MIGKNLIDLALPKRFGVMVVGIRRGTPAKILPPSPEEPLQVGDNLIIVSNESAIPRLIKGGSRYEACSISVVGSLVAYWFKPVDGFWVDLGFMRNVSRNRNNH